MVLTRCFTRVVIGLVIAGGAGHHEVLLLDHLSRGTDIGTNVAKGIVG